VIGNNQEAEFVGILGATGCGKTTELKKRLAEKSRPRTLIWSPKEALDNYAALFAGSVIVSTASEVLTIVKKAGKGGKFHIVFQPTLDQKRDMALFDIVCKIALAAGNLTLVVDELHSVTQAANAVHGWRKLNFMGRGYGVHVFGLSQRPASVDKAFMGSLSSIHVGRLPHPPDQKAVAEVLGVNRGEIAALTGYQAIKKDMLTGKVSRFLT
jgi:hypothetical protein